MSKGRRLKELLKEKPYIFTPGITTALHAMIVEKAGFDYEKRLMGHPMGAFHELAGFPKVKEQEAKYLPADEVRKKYEGAVGL